MGMAADEFVGNSFCHCIKIEATCFLCDLAVEIDLK